MTQQAADRPDYKRPEYLVREKDLELIDDLLVGTRRMWDRFATYVRKWKKEKPATHQLRGRCEEVFEGLGRVLSAAVGMLHAKAAMIEWNDASVIEEHWKNIDLAGTGGNVFVKRFSEAAVRDGTGLILVDHTPMPRDEDGNAIEMDSETEDAFGLRAKWSRYPRSQILSWATDNIDNRDTLVRVVLWEPTDLPDGKFGVKTVNRYRELFVTKTILGNIAGWTLWEETENAEAPFERHSFGVFMNRNGETRGTLPIGIAHAGRSDAVLVSTIPLLGVAWANLGHWLISSNLRFSRDLATFLQPVVTGDIVREQMVEGSPAPTGIDVGPLVGMHLKGENAKFEWAAPPTDGLVPLERGVAEKAHQMAQMGMMFLAKDTRAAETAEAKRLDATAENATLATVAQGIDDAINEAFKAHAWFHGIEDSNAPVYQINRDFESTALDPQTMAVYVAAVDRAGLPPRSLLEAWQSGGRIGPDVDLDELENEMMIRGLAIEDGKELDDAKA